MKRYILFALIGVALILSCAKDIVVEQPGELNGYYEGKFIIVKKWGSGSGSQTTEQYINWEFRPYGFFCVIDTIKNLEIQFCDFSGDYELGAQMVFSDISVTPGTCVADAYTEGEFSFIRKILDNADDTLIFSQISGTEFDKTKKDVILIKDDFDEE